MTAHPDKGRKFRTDIVLECPALGRRVTVKVMAYPDDGTTDLGLDSTEVALTLSINATSQRDMRLAVVKWIEQQDEDERIVYGARHREWLADLVYAKAQVAA